MYRTCVVNDAGLVKTVETLRVAKPTSTTDVWQKKMVEISVSQLI